MTPEQFNLCVERRKSRPSPALDAARLVLVNGYAIKEAQETIGKGCSEVQIAAAVAKIRALNDKISAAYGRGFSAQPAADSVEAMSTASLPIPARGQSFFSRLAVESTNLILPTLQKSIEHDSYYATDARLGRALSKTIEDMLTGRLPVDERYFCDHKEDDTAINGKAYSLVLSDDAAGLCKIARAVVPLSRIKEAWASREAAVDVAIAYCRAKKITVRDAWSTGMAVVPMIPAPYGLQGFEIVSQAANPYVA